MAKVRILSIDGGGMKGIITAMVLQRIEELLKEYSKNPDAAISDYFELVGGTSTGAIITALLLCADENQRPKYSPKDVVELYKTYGKEIFHKRRFYPINTLFGLFGSKHTIASFKEILESYFGELTMNDLLKDSVYTAYDTNKRQAVFFSTVTKGKEKVESLLVRDVVLASTAAPTYFPPVHIDNRTISHNCYVDGGIVANNPALCLMVESLKMPEHSELCDTMLLSMGNVSSPEFYPYKKVKRWGYFGWAVPLLNILLDGSDETAEYQVDKIFRACHIMHQYLRVELQTDRRVPGMDAISCDDLKLFEEFGYEIIHIMNPRIKTFVRRLIDYK